MFVLQRWFVVAAVAMTLMIAACGRWGFETRDAGQILVSADDAVPFSGAVGQGVRVDSVGARLAVTGGFATLRSRMPTAYAAVGATGVGDTIYVAGGTKNFPGSSNCGDDMTVFDPLDESLSTLATLPVVNQGLHLERTPDGTVYSLMGYCNTANSDEEKVYRWSSDAVAEHVGNFPTPAYYFTSGVMPDALGDPVLITAGGYGSGPLRDAVQIMDPGNGIARRLTSDLPSPRCLPAGATAGNTFYVFGGLGNTNCAMQPSPGSDPTFTDIVAASLNPESVEVVGQLPEGIAGACAVTRDDGNILIMGGTRYVDNGSGSFIRTVSDHVWKFSPSDNQAYALDPLSEPRTGMACGRTDSGRIFLVGGVDANMDPVDSIMVYEPYMATGTLVSGMVDSGVPNARWGSVWLDTDVPSGGATALAIRIGASEDTWSDDDAGWLDVQPGAPLPEVMPRGRYLQWRVTLATENPAASPTLYEVMLSYNWF